MIGNIVGRAIYDARTIDLPLNEIWWKIVKGEECHLNDIKCFDSTLHAQLSKLQTIHKNSKIIGINKDELLYDGVELEDLCINFVIPGTNIELVPRGCNIFLNLGNLESYLESFRKVFFQESMKPQFKGFIQGLTKVVSAKSFGSFYPHEIERLFYGESKELEWTEKELIENIIPTYGYTKESKGYLNFIKYLNNIKLQDRKEFLKFITGAPRLPLGGLAALTPKITVVKKTPTGKDKTDDILPSVMTCQNYVKLPDYSSYTILENKMRFAVMEGQKSFSLS